MLQLTVTSDPSSVNRWIIHTPLWFIEYDYMNNILLLLSALRTQTLHPTHPLSLTNKDYLLKIKDKLSTYKELIFYTDGSVQNSILQHLQKLLDDCLDHCDIVINQGAAFVKT
ncbi:hypothetical protein RclHR1_02580012 [Rhizophagus clarus]|uniref:Uncharacterized protein n=1 Tax=Rhizophagus clarus TaxID=94130 RepID=A0A2Z6RDD7_9GLOM|nr:hypothetical protein RclHR1_02580012 [Rhizophagus clarus]